MWTQISSSLVWLQSGEAALLHLSDPGHHRPHRAERALRASEERFRSIAEATQEWIWEIDADGVYTFCSPAVEAILGYAPDQLVGNNCLDILRADSRQTVAELWGRGN